MQTALLIRSSKVVIMSYPELNGKSFIPVQIKLKNQSIWRNGMFYLNGGKPIFASYGSNLTDKVELWRLTN